MAVGSTTFPLMHPVAGVRLGTASAGIRQTERDDLTLIELSPGTRSCGLFTRNAFCAAPVIIARDHLAHAPRWLIINSGNANAGTGKQGMEDALATCQMVAKQREAEPQQVLPFSTGVIGETLPVDKIEQALPSAIQALTESGWDSAAHAIMTTDTRPKGASQLLTLDNQTVTISGIAKGSGMIHPDMATMLAFIATDARIEPDALKKLLSDAVNRSFNRISVDGDTSTNDACLLMATGHAKGSEIKLTSSSYQPFAAALQSVCNQLAEAIVRDGEGATKLIRIQVETAESDQEAHQVANTVASSPLVKTAFFAADPNWGRILAAVGRAGIENFNLSKVAIWLNEVCIVDAGERATDYHEAAGQRVMAEEIITIRIQLGRGLAQQRVLSCDLSHEYVRINAEYRT